MGVIRPTAYKPFPIPHLDKEHRCDPGADHKAAISRLEENTRQKARTSAPLTTPCQEWVLYNARFLITGAICGDWHSFGGRASLIPHLVIVLNIAATENIATSLSYGRLVRADIQEVGRALGGSRIGAPLSEFPDLHKNEKPKRGNLVIREKPPAQTSKPRNLSAPRI